LSAVSLLGASLSEVLLSPDGMPLNDESGGEV
jgi:hypothetical protein